MPDRKLGNVRLRSGELLACSYTFEVRVTPDGWRSAFGQIDCTGFYMEDEFPTLVLEDGSELEIMVNLVDGMGTYRSASKLRPTPTPKLPS